VCRRKIFAEKWLYAPEIAFFWVHQKSWFAFWIGKRVLNWYASCERMVSSDADWNIPTWCLGSLGTVMKLSAAGFCLFARYPCLKMWGALDFTRGIFRRVSLSLLALHEAGWRRFFVPSLTSKRLTLEGFWLLQNFIFSSRRFV